MGHDDRREIFERLAALERMLRPRHGGRDDRDHHRGGRDRHHHEHRHERGRDRDGGHDNDFEEKRIIDTIVHLVCENVGRMLQDQQAQERREDHDEKRIIDLVVRLVSEHVGEIVATELDRRLGPPRGGGEEASPPDCDPPTRRRGTSDS